MGRDGNPVKEMDAMQWQQIESLVIQSDLFGMVKWPF